jgi:hypothetical protein
MAIRVARGFPDMLGCVGFMHWKWDNSLFDRQGQYRGHVGVSTIILEAVEDYDLLIWHSFFDMTESHNYINVLQCSLV